MNRHPSSYYGAIEEGVFRSFKPTMVQNLSDNQFDRRIVFWHHIGEIWPESKLCRQDPIKDTLLSRNFIKNLKKLNSLKLQLRIIKNYHDNFSILEIFFSWSYFIEQIFLLLIDNLKVWQIL